MDQQYFKKCQLCLQVWPEREDFIQDDDVLLIGYQSNFKALDRGLFLFNHSCDNTLSIKAVEFVDLYDGPVFEERKTGSENCPGYCLHQNDLRGCPAQCNCAYVREILQLLEKPDQV